MNLNQIKNPIFKVVFQGVCDYNSNFSKLHGMPHIVNLICNMVVKYWKDSISIGEKINSWTLSVPENKNIFYMQIPNVKDKFPKPKDINIEMMPFLLKDTFSDCKLPEEVKPYWDWFISSLAYTHAEDNGKVWYITIHETRTEQHENVCRRRMKQGNVYIENCCDNEQGNGKCLLMSHPCSGGGFYNKIRREGGIYMATNTKYNIWNCSISPDVNNNKTTSQHQDIEHLRELLPKSKTIRPNCISWLTDRTPYEHIPLTAGSHYQFVKIITSNVSLWNAGEFTENPLGVKPNPKLTKILKRGKYDNTRNKHTII